MGYTDVLMKELMGGLPLPNLRDNVYTWRISRLPP